MHILRKGRIYARIHNSNGNVALCVTLLLYDLSEFMSFNKFDSKEIPVEDDFTLIN